MLFIKSIYDEARQLLRPLLLFSFGKRALIRGHSMNAVVSTIEQLLPTEIIQTDPEQIALYSQDVFYVGPKSLRRRHAAQHRRSSSAGAGVPGTRYAHRDARWRHELHQWLSRHGAG